MAGEEADGWVTLVAAVTRPQLVGEGEDARVEHVVLVPAVRFKHRPTDGVLQATAKAKVQRVMRQLHAGGDVLADFGLDGSLAEMLADPDKAAGFGLFVACVAHAEVHLEAWEGIEDQDGAVPEISREAIVQALRLGPRPGDPPLLLDPYWAYINRPWIRRADEGKGSALSPSGSTAGARKRARPAKPKGARAPKA